jgi:CheY-like chemotaxis protein/HPt (histidine-containing phosphotransfer) domain-containing protein
MRPEGHEPRGTRVTLDREHLKRWYREAMKHRLSELRALRQGLRAGDPSVCDAARAIAQALRGSGATFGFPHLSAAAGQVESAGDAVVWRRSEGLIELVRALAAGDEADAHIGAEWLSIAAGGAADPAPFPDLGAAWKSVAERAGLSADELARRVAQTFGLQPAQLSGPSRAALRLVPEALMRSRLVLPLSEDSETVTVATADPTSLELEAELARLTGRTPRFVVAPPTALRNALSAVLDEAAPAAERAPPPSRPVRARLTRPETDRVLIVDDEASARFLARSLLEKGGYEVEEAGDGMEALERLGASQPVSLVVADLNMPRLDGLELIWEMRATTDWAAVPVIVVTAETDDVLETRLIDEGADDYIRKPLDARLFMARVAATIRRAET